VIERFWYSVLLSDMNRLFDFGSEEEVRQVLALELCWWLAVTLPWTVSSEGIERWDDAA